MPFGLSKSDLVVLGIGHVIPMSETARVYNENILSSFWRQYGQAVKTMALDLGIKDAMKWMIEVDSVERQILTYCIGAGLVLKILDSAGVTIPNITTNANEIIKKGLLFFLGSASGRLVVGMGPHERFVDGYAKVESSYGKNLY